MGNNNSKSPSVGMESYITETQKPTEKPKCKACCACPETKQVRDACIIEKGQENCTKLIEAHKECMRKMGFNI